MSLGRAVAQLIVSGVDGSQPTAAGLAPFRGHSWGGVVLGRGNFSSPAGVAQLVASLRAAKLRGLDATVLESISIPVNAEGLGTQKGHSAGG